MIAIVLKSFSFKTCSKSDTSILSSNIFSRQICSAFEWETRRWSFMTSTGSTLVLRLIWIDETPAMTLLVIKWANVAGEEACQVLNELGCRHELLRDNIFAGKITSSINLDSFLAATLIWKVIWITFQQRPFSQFHFLNYHLLSGRQLSFSHYGANQSRLGKFWTKLQKPSTIP